jgi:hypothetical protein
MRVTRVGIKLLGGIACIWSFNSCAGEVGLSFETREITTYPFQASQQRAATIRNGYRRITTGMSARDVKAILGDPDEVRALYEPVIRDGKLIGYTYWYVIRRLVRDGSVNEKKESLVRVSFELDDRVSRVDEWGIAER